MKTRGADIPSRTKELLDAVQEKLQPTAVEEWSLVRIREAIQSAAQHQETFEPVITKVRHVIQRLGNLNDGLLSLLEQLEKLQARQVLFGTAWWTNRREEIQKASTKEASSGLVLWVKTVAEALTAWDFSLLQELIRKADEFTPDIRKLSAEWLVGIEALASERYSDPLVEALLTALINYERPSRSSMVLDAPARAVLLIIRGRIFLYDLERTSEAGADIDRAFEMQPEDDELALVSTGEYYRMSGKGSEAVGFFQRVVHLTPGYTQGYLGLGLCAEDEGRVTEADAFFEHAAETVLGEPDPVHALTHLRFPDSGRAYLRLAEALRKNQDPETALVAATRAVQFDIRQAGKYPQRLAHRLKGEILIELGRPLEAADSLLEAGKSFVWEGESDTALDTLEKALSLKPDSWEIAWEVVDARYVVAYSKPADEKKTMVDSALGLWEKTISQRMPDTEHSWVYLTRAMLNEQLVQLVPPSDWRQKVALLGGAIAFVERSILLNEKRALAWALLARYYRELSLPENELAASARPFQDGKDVSEAAVLEERVMTLSNRNQGAAAESLLTGNLDPARNTWAKFVLAFLRLAGGQYEEVETLLKERPDTDWVIETRAIARDKRGDLAGGELDWQQLLSVSDSPESLREYGYAACKLGRYEDAAAKLAPLISNPVKHADAERMLTLCHLCQNQLQLADETFHRALQASSHAELRRWVDLDLRSPRLTSVVSEQVLRKFEEAADIQMKQSPPQLDEEIRHALLTLTEDGQPSWARVGLEASLARILLAGGKPLDAAAIYNRLRNLAPLPGSNLAPFP